EGTTLSVNFSPGTVMEGLPKLLGPVPWDRIIIELTEHVPVEDYAVLNAALAPLRAKGAQVAVDDTGAGFASLRHILDVAPDVIKIDIGSTRGVDSDPSRAAIAAMLVSFAERMGIRVVAEGVETEAERDTMLELGAVYGQGYLFGRPEIPA
ncbi:MAG TPA: EAL domain-containing protein, partial [Candidatus Nanopelagicales bacterium]|nr:EAL domain-containing protein [Candidatus Nanopelagicales bacterium]